MRSYPGYIDQKNKYTGVTKTVVKVTFLSLFNKIIHLVIKQTTTFFA